MKTPFDLDFCIFCKWKFFNALLSPLSARLYVFSTCPWSYLSQRIDKSSKSMIAVGHSGPKPNLRLLIGWGPVRFDLIGINFKPHLILGHFYDGWIAQVLHLSHPSYKNVYQMLSLVIFPAILWFLKIILNECIVMNTLFTISIMITFEHVSILYFKEPVTDSFYQNRN